MEAKDLSKQKHIYAVYMNSIGEIHCEKYPVIYADKEYVYYKTSDPGLAYQSVCTVKDALTEFDVIGHGDKCFWQVDKTILNKIASNRKRNEMLSDLKRKKKAVCIII